MSGFRIDWKLLIAITALIVSIFAGTVWRRPDVVFDKRAVEIPLSDPLRKTIEHALASADSSSIDTSSPPNTKKVESGPRLPSTKLPDKLIYVDMRNVGHVPSSRIKVRVVVPGEIADKEITDAGSAFGTISQLVESDTTGEISFDCQNLANQSQARVKIALWYQRTKSGEPSVEIQDTSEGPARQVSSIDDARFYLWEWAERLTAPLSGLAAVLGSLSTYLFAGRFRRKKPNFTAVYDPQHCGWAGGMLEGKPVMQVFVTASFATTEERPIEIVQAYLRGTKPYTNLVHSLVVNKESAVTDSFSFIVQPAVAKMGEAHRGRIILVDQHDNRYESTDITLPYRGQPTAPTN